MIIRMKTIGRRRALTLLSALVLVVASLIGSYAHASGHGHKHDGGSSQSFASGISGAVSVDDVLMNADGDASQPVSAHAHHAGHADCCDFACNGGIAILAADLALGRPVVTFEYHSAPAMLPDDRRSGLERPPQLS